jgi:beta-mannanase
MPADGEHPPEQPSRLTAKWSISMTTATRAIALSIAALMTCGTVATVVSEANAQAVNDKRPVITDTSIDFGAYDPHGDFSQDTHPKIEHLFLPWEDVDLSSLASADGYAQQRGRSLLITVEPWSWSHDWRLSPEQLYSGIMSGRYDANMAAICTEAAKLKSAVTIRWGQEMDDTEGQFTWAYWKPAEYVAAYQRMVTVCREHITTAHFMWSPKGNEGLDAYYPGDEYVDVVGLSVFGLQQRDRDELGRDRTFAETLAPAYHRVEAFNKPIVVAELGYEGDAAYVHNWADNAAKRNPDFPRLTAVVYFNDREVYPWPNGYGLPDWRVVQDATN